MLRDSPTFANFVVELYFGNSLVDIFVVCREREVGGVVDEIQYDYDVEQIECPTPVVLDNVMTQQKYQKCNGEG